MGDYKSFVDLLLNERQWIEVDIEGFGNLTDGKKPAFRCLPFRNSDWLNPEFGQFRGIPILSGKKSELDEEDYVDFLRFAKQIAISSVRFIREVDDSGESRWVRCKVVDTDEQPHLENDCVVMPLRSFDTRGNVATIAGAVLRDSNEGGRMAELAPAEGFRGEGFDPNGASSETDSSDPARDPPKQKRHAR